MSTHKHRMPRFTGLVQIGVEQSTTLDVDTFLFDLDVYFAGTNTVTDSQRVAVLHSALEGPAKDWLLLQQRGATIKSTRRFVQHSSVASYSARFQYLRVAAPDLRESAVHVFTRGLRDDIEEWTVA
ncbi:hypothetical protein RI367_002484 [Sorochytrium milnesiophthora]